MKVKGKVTLYSRRANDLTKRFDYIADVLRSLPDETVVDGELVALHEQGRPRFNLLQTSAQLRRTSVLRIRHPHSLG